MGKTIQSFLSAPPMDETEQMDQVRLLNSILLGVISCALTALVIALALSVLRSALVVGVLILILVGLKLLLNAKQFNASLWGFFAIVTIMNLLLSTILPEWSVLAIALSFIGITALLVKNIATSLILFIINTIGYFLLSAAYWTTNTETFLEFGEIALAAVLIILIVHYFSRISQNRAKDLINLIERLELENGQLKNELSQTHQKLIKEIETRELLELKIKDKLDADTTHRYNPQTGTLVEAAIKSVMTNEIARTQRYQRPLSLLCVRVDHFHPLLAQAGMTPGSLLSILADAFINTLRREDLIGHFGDDGFYILLPETGRYASYVVAERLRHLVEVMSLFNATDAVPLTVSIGLTSYQDQSKLNSEIFIAQALQALKEAEEHGGNWTINWHDVSHTL